MAEKSLVITSTAQLVEPRTRRDFLRLLGVGGSIVLLPSVFAACEESTGSLAEPRVQQTVSLDLSTDVGILNFAFALEQTEAAFYTMVMQNIGSSDLSQQERAVLSDIRDHEVIHREFYRTALGSARIPDLQTDFSAVRFNDRLSVLTTAATFEDTGVYAYNAAGKYLTDPANLLVAGKIVSVEARQAAALRDLIKPGSEFFAGDDTVNSDGLDGALEPDVVLHAADPFVLTPVRIGTPPKA